MNSSTSQAKIISHVIFITKVPPTLFESNKINSTCLISGQIDLLNKIEGSEAMCIMPPCRGSAALKAPCVSVCEPRYIYLSKITRVCTVLTWSHQSQIAWILSFVYIKETN